MGVHVTWGAFAVNVAASIASLAFATLWLIAWRRARAGYMLLLAVGWFGLCVYWGLLAVSAGPDPVLSRANIATMVRYLLLVSMAAMAAGKVALLRLAWMGRG